MANADAVGRHLRRAAWRLAQWFFWRRIGRRRFFW
jgi:hypothetical protein